MLDPILIILYFKFGGFSNFDGCQIFIGGGGTKEKASHEGRREDFYLKLSR